MTLNIICEHYKKVLNEFYGAGQLDTDTVVGTYRRMSNSAPRYMIHQQPLTPVQREWYNGVIDDMVEAGIISPIDPKDVKCVSPTTLAQKAHQNRQTLSLAELQHKLNDECIAHCLPPHFDLPPRPEVSNEPSTPLAKPLWQVCHNYAELNKRTKVAPMPPGDIQRK